MRKKITSLFMLLFITAVSLAAQPEYLKKGALIDGKTIVKLNVSTLPFGGQSASLERIISKRLSLTFAAGQASEGKIPYTDQVIDFAMDKFFKENETDMGPLKTALSSFRYNNLYFSPEIRFYLGKGYGRGFYIAPYYLYQNLGLNQMDMAYTYEDEGVEYTESIQLKGHVNSQNLGINLGKQWLLGKRRMFVIDWKIIGLHGGFANSNISAKYDGSYADYRQEAQQFIDDLLNDTQLPPSVKITGGQIQDDNSVAFDIESPWAFLRTSISVGIRF